MKQTLLVVDEFHPEPLKLREEILDRGFESAKGPHGEAYEHVQKLEDPALFELLAEAVGFAITPQIAACRLDLAGEYPHNFCHADTVCAEYAALLYLNPQPPPEHGTAFYRHGGLGINRMPSRASLAALGMDVEPFVEELEKEWHIEDRWSLDAFASLVFNRLVVYPTSYFHGRTPLEGFGTGPQDGRLLWMCFFDRADEPVFGTTD